MTNEGNIIANAGIEYRVETFRAQHFILSDLMEDLGGEIPVFHWESTVGLPANNLLTEYRTNSYRQDRIGILAINPICQYTVKDNIFRTIRFDGTFSEVPFAPGTNDIFSIVDIALSERKNLFGEPDLTKANKKQSVEPFYGGVVGLISYDAYRYIERLPSLSGNNSEPDLLLLSTSTTLTLTPDQNTLILTTPLSNNEDIQKFLDSTSDRLKEAIGKIERRSTQVKACTALGLPASSVINSPKQTLPEGFSLRFSRKDFSANVARAIEYIQAGDIYQVVLANLIKLPRIDNTLKAFKTLCNSNPSPFHFYLQFEDVTYLGCSPELLLEGSFKNNGDCIQLRMRLVAGTYGRKDEGSEVQNVQQLLFDTKEKAEHLMLVDHARNDIGKVSRTGSVMVPDLFSVESYSDVHHLVSEVQGTLKPGLQVSSALKSCFPIATLVGTPKVRAAEIIAELEGPSRGIFGGGIVIFGDNGTLQSTVAIRAMLTTNSGTMISAGAGIVYDSNVEREFEECLLKANALVKAATNCSIKEILQEQL